MNKIKSYIQFLNENLKSAVNFERDRIARDLKKTKMIKWFDSLPIEERQELYYEYKGRKKDLTFIKDADKICIYNKKHNGDYNKY